MSFFGKNESSPGRIFLENFFLVLVLFEMPFLQNYKKICHANVWSEITRNWKHIRFFFFSTGSRSGWNWDDTQSSTVKISSLIDVVNGPCPKKGVTAQGEIVELCNSFPQQMTPLELLANIQWIQVEEGDPSGSPLLSKTKIWHETNKLQR